MPFMPLSEGDFKKGPTNDSTTRGHYSSVPHNKGILGSHGNPCDFVVRPHPTNDQSHLHTLNYLIKKNSINIKITYSYIDFSFSLLLFFPWQTTTFSVARPSMRGPILKGQTSPPARQKSLSLLTRVSQDHPFDNMDLTGRCRIGKRFNYLCRWPANHRFESRFTGWWVYSKACTPFI